MRVTNSGKFTLKSGTITGNKAALGGGVFVSQSSTFTMDGGTITGNEAPKGSGVYIYLGTFDMKNGAITGNAPQTGGGVYMYGGTFKLSGRVDISGNGKDYKDEDVVTVTRGRSIRFTKLKRRAEYKAYVRAWKKVGGEKFYLGDSPEVHAITGGYNAKYCNTKSVTLDKDKLTLKVGKRATLKATLTGVRVGKKLLNHMRQVRFYTTNVNVATVNKNGKVKATGKGTCTIWAIANNGVRTSVKVTVK